MTAPAEARQAKGAQSAKKTRSKGFPLFATVHGPPQRVYESFVNGVRVSTVYLRHDFETMVFGGEYDQQAFRALTPREAEQIHQWVIEALRHGRDPWCWVMACDEIENLGSRRL